MNIETIVGSRRSGKTTEILKRSASEGLYILTGTKRQAQYIFDQAKSLGYNIPFPVTWHDFTSGNLHGTSAEKDGVLIDELNWIVSYIMRGIPIKGVTWTKYKFRDLDLENPDNPWIGYEERMDELNEPFVKQMNQIVTDELNKRRMKFDE